VTKILRFRKSPDTGEDCLCSLCREPIYITAIRCFGSENDQGFESNIITAIKQLRRLEGFDYEEIPGVFSIHLYREFKFKEK